MDLVDPATPLPPWFTEEDLQAYADLYQKSGFQIPLQIPYRVLKMHAEGEVDLNSLPKVEVPTLLIMGEKDYFKFPGMEDYVRGGMVKHFVPDLEIIYMLEGSYFVHKQSPDEAEKMAALVKTANVKIDSYRHGLFAKLFEKKDIEDLILNIGAGGAGPVAVTSAVGAPAEAAAPAAEEKKNRYQHGFNTRYNGTNIVPNEQCSRYSFMQLHF